MPKEKSGIAGVIDNIVAKGGEGEGTGFRNQQPPKRASILEEDARKVAGVSDDDIPSDTDTDESGGKDEIVHMKDLFKRAMSGKSAFEPPEEEVKDEEEEKAPKEREAKSTDDKEEDDKTDEEDESKAGEDDLTARAEELLAIDADKLITKRGGPVNPEVTTVVKKLKRMIRDFTDENKKLKKRKVEVDPAVERANEALKQEHEELKKKWEERYFEETPEWKDTFEKPVQLADAEAAKWLSAHEYEDNSDEKQNIDAYKTLMHESLYNGDEVKFYKASDHIAELLPKGIANRFVAASVKLWDAHALKADAYKNKDESRKSVLNKSNSFVNEASTEAINGIDTIFQGWETRNKEILDVYKNDPKYKGIINYKETVVGTIDTAKKHLDHAIRARKVSPELQELVFQGSLAALKNKEMEGLRTLVKSLREDIDVLEKKVGEKDKTLSRVKVSKNKSVSSSKDDDDDDETPKSMKELWQKRMKTA